MLHAEVMGERALIASIITQAINDSVIFKKPRHPSKRGFKVAKQKKLLELCAQCFEVIDNPAIYSESFIALCYRFIEQMPKTLFRRATNKKEEDAYEARQFLSAKSEIFRIYTSMLDIDADYLEEKIKKEIALHEAGKKNIIKKDINCIDIIKVNTL